jgi:small GTP-binding protein
MIRINKYVERGGIFMRGKEILPETIIPPMKVVLIGDTQCGKSALLQRLKSEKFDTDMEPTIGAEYGTFTFIKEKDTQQKMDIWDTAGQPRFRSLTPMYTRGSDAILMVFDLTNRDSFNHVTAYLKAYRDHENKEQKIILVGTKADDDDHREVKPEEIEALKAELKLDAYVETSAKTDFNVRAVFEQTAELLLQTRNKQSAKKNPKQAPEKTEEEVRQELIKQLNAYIERVESHKIPPKEGEKEGPSGEQRINFGHGLRTWIPFLFTKKSQALNRRANYYLAVELRKELNAGKPLSELFTDNKKINNLRDSLIEATGISDNKKYSRRGIHSTTLNNIIKEGIKQGKKMR